MNMTALQVKTCYSMLSSLNSIKNLVKKAKSLGYTSLAITDSNNMFGVVEFYKECISNDIKPIIGLELSYDDKVILLYAMNNNGYKNLSKLSTIVSERPIAIDDLNTYKDDLILIMPFSCYIEEVYNLFSIKYIGYKNLEEKKQIKEPKIFINDVSYLENEDYKYLDYLLMIKNSKVLGEYELHTHIGKHLFNSIEINHMCDLEDINNSNDVSLKCNVEIKYTPGLLPIYDEKTDGYEYLCNLCQKGLLRRLNGKVDDDYQNRLDYELSIIKKMGFSDYFLVVFDYVRFAKNNDILVGPGRGSAAGSLVSYVIGITDVDPMQYDLIFERFLNPERITMPDIDIDFDDIRKEEVINYIVNKYGRKKAVGIITFNTLGAKQVIRDVSRILKIDNNIVDLICKNVTDVDLISTYKNDSKFKSLIDSSSETKKMFDICLRLEHLPRHSSIHAAGLVISNKDIDEVIPLYKSDTGIYLTAYSMYYIEELGLLKMDLLSLSNLSFTQEVIKNIRETEKININFNNIPYEDDKIFKLFSNVDTEGIFQFESPGMKNFLRKLKIANFDEVVASLSLFRPGPMQNIDLYIKRRNNKTETNYYHKDLESILKPTYGIIVYQEQIMQVVNVMGGYSYGEADVLRRAISKKKEDILLKEREKFVNKSINRGYDEDIANKVYDMIYEFANYGFNKSHSVCYGIIACKMAYLKVYFFKYFATGLLNNVIGNETKTKNYIAEIRNKNIDILMPNINLSGDKYIACNEGIQAPLSIIHGIGVSIINEIVSKRNDGEYKSFIDFMMRVNSSLINKKVIASLILSGAFETLGYNRKTLIENLDVILNYVFLNKDASLFETIEPEITIYEEYDKSELVSIEFETFGLYLSNHPVTKYRNNKDITSNVLEDNFNKNVSIVLMIDYIKEVVTKKNEIMVFIDGSDEFRIISLTMFPETYKMFNNISKRDIIRFYGRVEKRFDKYQIIVRNVEKIAE